MKLLLLVCLLPVLIRVNAQFATVSKAEFEKLMLRADAQRIDVRSGFEHFFVGHIEGFKVMNGSRKNFEANAVRTLDKNKPVLLYCFSGHRSREAIKKLQAVGFREIYELEGGYLNWLYGRK